MLTNIPIQDNSPRNIPIFIKDEAGATLHWDGGHGYFVTEVPCTTVKPIYFPTPVSMAALERRFGVDPRALM